MFCSCTGNCNRKFDANTQLWLMTATLFASALNKNVTQVDGRTHERFTLVSKNSSRKGGDTISIFLGTKAAQFIV
jgi:hypothetical protein